MPSQVRKICGKNIFGPRSFIWNYSRKKSLEKLKFYLTIRRRRCFDSEKKVMLFICAFNMSMLSPFVISSLSTKQLRVTDQIFYSAIPYSWLMTFLYWSSMLLTPLFPCNGPWLDARRGASSSVK